MELSAKIFVAGHRGLVGSALVKKLRQAGYHNLLLKTRQEVDLTRQDQVEALFNAEKPHYVFLAAAKVGGILANDTQSAAFLSENLLIQTHVIEQAHQTGVRRLLFLGSSCIYPKLAPQPIVESALMSGPLEPTNAAYATAKIAGIALCQAHNKQHGTRFFSVMPTNLYGPGDQYDLATSHVLPALIRRFHEARQAGADSVTLWGTGAPLREFLYSEDLAEACLFLINHPDPPDLINIGSGQELSIRALAEEIKALVGYTGTIHWDHSKPDGTPRKRLDTALMTGLGWQATTPLAEGLKKVYEDFKAR